MPEECRVVVKPIRIVQSQIHNDNWAAWLLDKKSLTLPAGSTHTIDLQAETHSTAFIRWTFSADKASQVKLKITYSEGYELEPRSYPFFRSKSNRLDAENGHLIGPYDEVLLDIPVGRTVEYEPFWFRTFRIIRLEITIPERHPVEMISLEATQVNYPMAVKASWEEPGDAHSEKIWEVSIRTMRNCMFDGYSDCPFYEQLQLVYPLSCLVISLEP